MGFGAYDEEEHQRREDQNQIGDEKVDYDSQEAEHNGEVEFNYEGFGNEPQNEQQERDDREIVEGMLDSFKQAEE